MNNPHLTRSQFKTFAKAEIDVPWALREAMKVIHPDGTLTVDGSRNLFRALQTVFLSERIRLARKQYLKDSRNPRKKPEGKDSFRDTCSTLADRLDHPPVYRYGHSGNWLLSKTSSRKKDGTEFHWDKSEARWMGENEDEIADFQYEALKKSGAFTNPVFLVQINWSGVGFKEDAPFFTNSLNHNEGQEHLPQQGNAMWKRVVKTGKADVLTGAYMTDFYKLFSSPQSETFAVFNNLTLDVFTVSGDQHKRAEWEQNLADEIGGLNDVAVPALKYGVDLAGDITPLVASRIYITDLLYMAMLILLCKEAELLNIEHPIMVPWHKQTQQGLIVSTLEAAGARNFPFRDRIPFLNGYTAYSTFNLMYLHHPRHYGERFTQWLEGGNPSDLDKTIDMIAQYKREWMRLYGA
ncbi:hypothetical protein [Bifidobacterium pseudolongum]|uniref:hypothetical protein n=1 Tax=Bifidobacterium pseudolongum TaxID=1694 RepID=UPI000C714C10|nr:hypothetical protein [Bifidobacterium pseudolongum]PKV00008.1 hypothetical protein CQR52_1087 [Bifidobacterium pseudolongum subsp. pseudolongum]RYQ53709.1 hypothetical protein PG1604B_0075 [Bifidobacterium pseudolongum subsp. pseudolongum]